MNPIKPIIVNGRFLSQRITGVQRYAFELLQALDRLRAQRELPSSDLPILILAPPDTLKPPFVTMQFRTLGPGTGQLWEQGTLPLHCLGRLLFTPCGGAPLLHPRQVFTMHDAGVFATRDAYSARYGAWYRWHHRMAARRSGLQLLTVSNFSQHQLAEALGIAAERFKVTPLGHEHALQAASDSSVLQRLHLDTGSYLLAVGSANPNKNISALLKAFTRVCRKLAAANLPPVQLVLAGGDNHRIFGAGAVTDEAVISTGYLPDGALRALYENALGFVFPSRYEGFGLPPVEAMALGCPVASSNAASLPEVCADAAVFFPPDDIEQMADAMLSLITQPSLRTALIERGHLQQQQFQWARTARATWSVLLEAAFCDPSGQALVQ